MSDINFLPKDQHHEEKRKNFSRVLDIQYSQPVKRPVIQTAAKAEGQGGFLSSLGRFFKKKNKIESRPLSVKPNFQTASKPPEVELKNETSRISKNFLTQPSPVEQKNENGQKKDDKKTEKKNEKEPPIKTRIKFGINLIPEKFKLAISRQHKIKTLVIFVVSLIFVLFLTYVGLYRLMVLRQIELRITESEIDGVQKKIESLKRADRETNRFLNLLKEVKNITENHILTTSIFEFLERNTLKTVYYESLAVNTENKTIVLNAMAQNYESLAAQMLYFKSLTEEVETVELMQADLKEEVIEQDEEEKPVEEKQELVNFNVMLKLKSDLFYY